MKFINDAKQNYLFSLVFLFIVLNFTFSRLLKKFKIPLFEEGLYFPELAVTIAYLVFSIVNLWFSSRDTKYFNATKIFLILFVISCPFVNFFYGFTSLFSFLPYAVDRIVGGRGFPPVGFSIWG